jgi:hypothetical protein
VAIIAGKPAGRDEFHWDKNLPGFGVRMQASGMASYVIEYRPPSPERRRLRGVAEARVAGSSSVTRAAVL